MTVGNGKVRSLKADSGHGLAQVISLLSILSLIVITGSRRILVMDEVISGLSVNNRRIITDILWTFTQIGFQFIVNDHGFIPKGSKVFHLEMQGDVSHIKDTYIEGEGVYLQGQGQKLEPGASAKGNISDGSLDNTTLSEEQQEVLGGEVGNTKEANGVEVVASNVLSI